MTGRHRVTAAVLTLRFLIAVIAFGTAELLSEHVRPTGDGMPAWAVITTMAVVGAIFALTARPLVRLAERVVLRDHADAYEAGRSLLRRMSTALPVEDVLPALAEMTGRTLQVERSEIRLRLDGGQSLSQVWPERAGSHGAPVVVEVRHDGGTVGELEADVPRAADANRETALLRQLAGPAGLAMSTVRLTVELQRRAARLRQLGSEIAASSARIAQARHIEARTIGAEISARVDPHLSAAADLITAAQEAAGDDGARLVDRARAEVGDALDELRNLARRIYPPRLRDGGLAAALEGWQLRTGTGLDLLIEDDQRIRGDAAIQSCLYFLLIAALAVRPAGGARQTVAVRVLGERVLVDVDGPATGGSDTEPAADATLAAIRDRVEAFGGEATAATAGGRRTVRAWLPIEQVTP